jgi:hypothetical protein
MNQLKWAEAKQAETIVRAEQSGAEWTGRELTVLSEMKAANVPVAQIAAQLQRSYYAVSSKIQVAGLAATRQTAPSAPVEVCGLCWMDHAGECL